MKRASRGFVLILLLGLACTSAHASAPAGCDRGCLTAILDQYLAAVLKHKPAAAPLAVPARATENAVEVRAGAGIWKTVTGFGAIQRRYADVVTGQAVFFGTLMEGSVVDIVALRLRVNADRKVTEAEWTIARKSDGNMFSDEGILQYPPPPEAPLAAADRTARMAMVYAANSYFTGLEIHDGAAVPHVSGCERVENGFKVTNRDRALAPIGAAAATEPAGGGTTTAQETRSGDCAAGFEGFAKTIAQVYPRRYLVDEEQGVVIGQVILHRPPGVATKRNLLTEIFYIRGGKIAGIQTAMYYLDAAAPDTPGW